MSREPSPVVVLTGASSGIGRATAHAFAERGARLVLASRDLRTLAPVARECEERGGQALAVPTDVVDEAAVRALGAAAIERFGHFDVWINNVGVGAVGLFDEVPVAQHRRVIEANLIGHVHGSHVALAHFRARRRGTLVNLASLGGWVPAPYAASYVASKFGVRGLTDSIRAETSGLPDVHVCGVYPTFVDTPGVAHGANHTGKRLRPPSPMLDPRDVADTVVSLVESPRPTAMVGAIGYAARAAHAIAPTLEGRLAMRAAQAALARAHPAADSDGNLFQPSVGTSIDGGYRRGGHGLALAAAAAVGLAAVLLGGRLGRRAVARALPLLGR